MGEMLQEATNDAYQRQTFALIFVIMGMLLLMLGSTLIAVRPRYGGAYLVCTAIVLVVHTAIWNKWGVMMHEPERPSVLSYTLPVATACFVVYVMGKAVREPDARICRVQTPLRMIRLSLILHVAVVISLGVGALLLRNATDVGLMWRVVPPTLEVISALLFGGGLIAAVVMRLLAKPGPETWGRPR